MTRRASAATTSREDDEATTSTLHHILGNLGKRHYWGQQSQPTHGNPAPPHAFSNRPKPPHTPASIANVPPEPPNPPSAVKRKRGRPSLESYADRQLQQPTPGLASPGIESNQERHPPSNSTSPHLANVVSHQSRKSPLPFPNTVLPSPSPSEDTNLEGAPTPAAQNNGEPMGALPAASDELAYLRELQHAANSPPDKRPRLDHAQSAQGVSQRAQEERRVTATPPGYRRVERQPQSRPDQVRTASTGQAQPRSPSLGSPHIQVQTAVHQPQQGMQIRPPSRPQSSAQTHPQTHVQTSATPPQVQTQFANPQPQNAYNMSPALQSPGVGVPYPTPDQYTIQDCRLALARFEGDNRRTELGDRDRKRLSVLKHAMDTADWNYLSMHHYFALLELAPKSLPRHLQGSLNPTLTPTLHFMRDVLDTNNQLSPAVQNFFLNFPMPFGEIATNFPIWYKEQERMFLQFMAGSPNWPKLQEVCVKRRYPPLVRELYFDLGIQSAIFQQIVFRAALRRVWGPAASYAVQAQQHFEAETMRLFEQNQFEFFQPTTFRQELNNMAYKQHGRNTEAVTWGAQLKSVCARHDNWLRAHQPQAPRVQQTPVYILPSNDVGSVQEGPQQARQMTEQQRRLLHEQQHQRQQQQQQQQQHQHQQLQQQVRRGPGRPRLNDPVPSHQQLILRPQSGRPPPSQFLLPAPGRYLQQQRMPHPGRFALHEANVKSPVLTAQNPRSRLYRYMKYFAKPPVRLREAATRVELWNVPISAEALQSIPRYVPASGNGEPAARMIDENSQLIRLRCVKWPSNQPFDHHVWAVKDTSWIPYAYFTFNGSPLHPRKKIHHGKDLPVDLNANIKEGDNKLEISLMRKLGDEAYLNYLLAVEVVGIMKHEDIIKTCLATNRIPASQVVSAIKNKLSASSNDDDDIAIVQSSLTINLCDPFSKSQICTIPVRGRACLHNDCFDLETFLQTRERKDDASLADVWKCPICSADARPHCLVTDGFLQDVRTELEAKNHLNVRTIVVDQDGSWQPKEEVPPDPGSPDNDDDELLAPRTSRTTPANVEVIDLSD